MWNDIKRIDDEAESVVKFVFSRSDAVAEAVLYRYPDYATRTAICCSTQSGCPVGCRFCGAGDYFVRSLSAEEIVSQAAYCVDQTGVDPAVMGRLQIMFMSMGEPLLNLKGLLPSLEVLHARYPNAALLISTSAPRVNYDEVIEASQRIPTIGLQFSVHESTDPARDLLIPFKAKLSLSEIAEEGRRWHDVVGRKPFFNYCAHDENETDADADRVASLFDPEVFCATVSVVCERSEGLPATNQHQRDLASSFAARLVARGFDVRVFDPAGQDTIGGGCGQLWFVQQWMTQNPGMARPSVGRGLPGASALGPFLGSLRMSDKPKVDIELTADNLQADIVGFIVDRMRQMECAYRYMTEDQQRDLIQDARVAARALIEEVVRTVASEERLTITAELAKVVNDGKKIVGTLECSKADEHRHSLFDSVGSAVLIVVADPEEYMGGEMPEPDPDQRHIDDYTGDRDAA